MLIRAIGVEVALNSASELVQTKLPYVKLFQAIEVSVADQTSDVFVELMINTHRTRHAA